MRLPSTSIDPRQSAAHAALVGPEQRVEAGGGRGGGLRLRRGQAVRRVCCELSTPTYFVIV